MALKGESETPMDPCDEPVFKTLKRQAASEVVNFSSQYGPDHSRSYTVHNVVGEYSIYPSYGDFTQTLVFVSVLTV